MRRVSDWTARQSSARRESIILPTRIKCHDFGEAHLNICRLSFRQQGKSAGSPSEETRNSRGVNLPFKDCWCTTDPQSCRHNCCAAISIQVCSSANKMPVTSGFPYYQRARLRTYDSLGERVTCASSTSNGCHNRRGNETYRET